MAKLLLVNTDKCAGCRTCEMVCSAQHEGVINPFQSRIKIIKLERDGEGFPTVCAQCDDAPCAAICPVGAITRDEELGRMQVNYDKCIECRMCVAACPFGFMHYDTIQRRVIKCDLCDGDPICVKFCPYEALEFVDPSELDAAKRRSGAAQLKQYMKNVILGT